MSVGVNTDARTVSNITLSEEYAKLNRAFGWDAEFFLNCNRNALEAAFIPDDVREKLMARLVEGYQHAL
jgi:adenosine deaminase